MDKRGVLGLDIVRVAFILIMIIAVLAVAIPLTLVSLRQSTDLVARNTVVFNATLTTVDENGEYITGTQYLRDCQASLTLIVNATDNANIYSNASAWDQDTTYNCLIKATDAGVFNNTNWIVTGTYNYAIYAPTAIAGNITTAQTAFFSNTATIYSILIVVVVILAIAIIIALVMRFRGGGGESFGGMSLGSGNISIRRGGSGSGTLMGV
jgi:hypothetical protein